MAELGEGGQLTIKLVFYGPALSGKTTNLVRLHDLIAPERKGEIMVLDTQDDRTLFFDVFPLGFRAPSGLLLKFKLYTVPGQVPHNSTRKALLSRADGVIFVADSQRNQTINNGESFNNLAENLATLGLAIEQLPVVVQFNKRDLPDVVPEEELRARWSNTPWRELQFAAALRGDGVVETFRALLARLYPVLDAEFELNARHGLDGAAFVAAGAGSAPVLPA